MKAASINAETVDDYIRDFPREVREVLKALRRAIREVAPDAEESISYRIPTYRIGKKPLVYFAAYQHHVSLYPSTERSVEPLPRLAPYRSGRGTLKFPLDKPVPLALVKQFVQAPAERGTRPRQHREACFTEVTLSNQRRAQQQLGA
jgi:uncharacterized protein YdhG (YjbR/CyaY superfamily)